ncbi:hypothetical protein SAMD00019534_004790 [Acytostelium subglobosum LB1]|uniref:hypothetical protein n=1 Tax=Acytostelium subglobosum LB1 TaxID=1410327 RepID=UPI000644B682|nr:hypothetical protein SAMD00019534_004790 [Acytostelium subglobosum LB1]GAM17304.1 hypothetical protein SAMD00019534_004790 [Acytostelium subglobosum LB1]|eukprot:XP_012759366.1 hypothetical protein SAMD00019534_004790 [Acytostelium subglobosum LB1]
MSSSLVVPTKVSKMARSLIPKYKSDILMTGDQMFINDLLPYLNINKLSNDRCGNNLSSNLLLPRNASVEQHLTHFEQMFKYKLIDRRPITERQATDTLIKSKEDTKRMIGYDSKEDIDDKYRLAIIKILLYINPRTDNADKLIIQILNDYISTGDLALIPLWASIEHYSSVSLISSIVEHGTLAQAKCLIQFMASKPELQSWFNDLGQYRNFRLGGPQYPVFMTSHNCSLKLEVLIMLNQHNIIFDTPMRPWIFDSSMEMLEFLMSDSNKIVEFSPLFIDIKHLDLVNLILSNSSMDSNNLTMIYFCLN